MKDPAESEKEEVLVEAAIVQMKNRPNSWFSIDELCVSLSISKRTFYQYFETKNKLIEKIISKLIHKWKSESQVGTKTSISGNIKASFLSVYTYHINEIIGFNSDFLNNLKMKFPKEYVAMDDYFAEVRKVLLSILEEGKKLNVVKDGYNLEVFIEKEISFFEYLQKKHHLFQNKEEYIRLLNLSLDGLLKEDK